MNNLEPEIRRAVRGFWHTRGTQSTKQPKGTDRGARGAVTGGKQMDGFVGLINKLLVEARIPLTSVVFDKRVELPGWFRAEKKWDLAVVHEGQLYAAVEFKSQVGPSFGNNFNNRTEEALGSATDIWAAYREGAFKLSSRPFLGYVMLLEDCPASNSPVKVSQPHFPVFPAFIGASYRDRYRIFIEKLLRDRVYDGACFMTTPSEAMADGAFSEPDAELTFSKFSSLLVAHCSVIAGSE